MAEDEALIGAPLDADAVVRDWAKAGSQLDLASRRAVVATLIHELRRPGGAIRAWTDALYDFDPALALSVDDSRVLRRAIHEHGVANRPPAEVVELQDRLGVLIDDLIVAVTQHRISALEETALLDPLTGLRNRRAASQAFDSAFAHTHRHNQPVAIAIADLVGLKRINDTHGHPAGDDALRRFATALSENLRAGDAAFRFGGDEFVVLAPNTTKDELQHLFERMGDQTPAFSVGIAEAPLDGENAATLLAVADERLYDGRRATVAPPRRVVSRLEVGVATFALVTVVVIVAEWVRSLANVDVHGSALTAWHAMLLGTPFLVAARSSYAGPVDVRGAVRRGTNLAGIAMLALIAALTPLLSISARQVVPETTAPGDDTTTTNGPTELSAPPTSTTTAMPTIVPTVASRSLPRAQGSSLEPSDVVARSGPRRDPALVAHAPVLPTPIVTTPTPIVTTPTTPTTVAVTRTPTTTVPPTTTTTTVVQRAAGPMPPNPRAQAVPEPNGRGHGRKGPVRDRGRRHRAGGVGRPRHGEAWNDRRRDDEGVRRRRHRDG